VRLEDDQWGTGIHPSALVSPQAQLAEDVTVGPYCVLGSCRVGAGSRIGAFCRIHDGVVLGRRVKIREHASLGGVGFGAERGPDGILARFPHHGSVIVEDGVEIFPYANVDRGTFGPTRVGEGTFVDHYVHIGHNSSVGRHCIITAQVVLCGKSVIEDRVWLGVGSIIREGRRVGADATVGLGTVVIKDVPAGATVAGVPARHIRSVPPSS
jgi:UDP-3-O-[3-hydroxymyristoyl] glucosamine N-acyltransferase